MFSGQLQPYLEPRKLADQGAEINCETTVASLPRLAEFQDSQANPVKIALRFDRLEGGARVISGVIETSLGMTCQRCLELVDVAVRAEVDLTMVWTEEQAKALADGREPYLVYDDKMPFAELLEEEILLSLPAVALHKQCPKPLEPEGSEVEEEASAQRDNPFSVLAKLKSQQQD